MSHLQTPDCDDLRLLVVGQQVRPTRPGGDDVPPSKNRTKYTSCKMSSNTVNFTCVLAQSTFLDHWGGWSGSCVFPEGYCGSTSRKGRTAARSHLGHLPSGAILSCSWLDPARWARLLGDGWGLDACCSGATCSAFNVHTSSHKQPLQTSDLGAAPTAGRCRLPSKYSPGEPGGTSAAGGSA